MTRRRRSLRAQLDIAKAQLRAIKTMVVKIAEAPKSSPSTEAHYALNPDARPVPIISTTPTDPDQFIMGWSVSRGSTGVAHCLDASGQVWERVVEFDEADRKTITAEYWKRVAMERR